MNRTDRLYALVEELRAIAPRPRTARQLADHFEVSVRTIERDIGALQQAGVPLYARTGPGGGYVLDKAHTLPPVNFTPDEAIAVAVALARPASSPLASALGTALRKVVAAMPESQATLAHRLAGRIALVEAPADVRPAAAATLEEALLRSRVVEIGYEDRFGQASARVVEPQALVGSENGWYLVAHCRLRDDSRVFRLDRVATARLTGEAAPERPAPEMPDTPRPVRWLTLTE